MPKGWTKMTRLVAGFLIAFFAATPPTFSSFGGIITGNLLALNSTEPNRVAQWRPFEGASIQLFNVFANTTAATTQSDAAGQFSFTSIVPGDYGVEVRTKEACAFSDVIHVTDGSKTSIQLRLRERACSDPISF